MEIKILRYQEKNIAAEAVKELYRDAGWWEERELKDIDHMLSEHPSVGAWDGENLIGFARAVTDGRFRAYVEDVVIHSEWRRNGVGKMLVSKLLEELEHIDIVSLFCEDELIPFYQEGGFKYSKSQFVMHRKKAVKETDG